MSEIGMRKDDLDTPVLWADLDILERNIATLAAYFQQAGVHWRPHTKGIKVPAIAHQMLDAGAIGVTCAKLGEAEVMAAAGIRDILIANQVVGARKYARLAALQRHAHVKIAVDSHATLAHLGEAACRCGVEIGVLIEVDVGMGRAGVPPGSAVLDLARLVEKQPGLCLEGLMAWEGHTLTVADPDQKRRAIEEAIDRLVRSADRCRVAGVPVSIVSCGGSGTMHVTPHLAGVTEVQAGGAIFADVTYQGWGVPTQPALFVHTVVTSRPAPDRIIVDAGFKALPAWVGPAQPVGLPGVVRVAASAEHGIVTLAEPNGTVQVGDRLDFIVGYGDATVFLHDDLYGIRNGIVEVVWPIAGRGKLR